jgi:flagellin
MAAVLGTNMASVWASKNLQTAQADMASSVERLSSGLRINKAKDDAAGLGIANILTQQINGSNQGIRNLNDGISMVQTAEGALSAATEMAQRILTLATQGKNTNMSSDQLESIAGEMNSLWSAIGQIQARTQFTGNSLLGGSAITIQSSNVSGDTISITAAALDNIHASANGDSNTTVDALFDAIDAAQSTPATSDMTAVLGAIDDYITMLDTQRSTLGSIQNQMEYSVNNISELSANLTSARSRIIDTDYATETASLTKGQILQQAATAMLAQANQMPNVILSLLK